MRARNIGLNYRVILSFVSPAGMDYEAVNTTVSFPQDSVNGTEICIEIPIIDDDCFEKYEIFWFHIYATEPNLHIYNHEYVPVHIYDDEGEKFKKLESLR